MTKDHQRTALKSLCNVFCFNIHGEKRNVNGQTRLDNRQIIPLPPHILPFKAIFKQIMVIERKQRPRYCRQSVTLLNILKLTHVMFKLCTCAEGTLSVAEVKSCKTDQVIKDDILFVVKVHNFTAVESQFK